jgi:hypothetical protein
VAKARRHIKDERGIAEAVKPSSKPNPGIKTVQAGLLKAHGWLKKVSFQHFIHSFPLA